MNKTYVEVTLRVLFTDMDDEEIADELSILEADNASLVGGAVVLDTEWRITDRK